MSSGQQRLRGQSRNHPGLTQGPALQTIGRNLNRIISYECSLGHPADAGAPVFAGAVVHRLPAPQDADGSKQGQAVRIGIAALPAQWPHGRHGIRRAPGPAHATQMPCNAMKSVKGLVARQKRKETGPRMSGRIGTGGTDRSAKEDASFREGGSCFGSAYWPWLSPATSATRSIVMVLKKTSAGKGLSPIRYAIGCVASREPPFSSLSWSEKGRAGHWTESPSLAVYPTPY